MLKYIWIEKHTKFHVKKRIYFNCFPLHHIDWNDFFGQCRGFRDVLSNSSNDEVGIGENGIVELDGVEIGESGSQDDGEDVLEADAGTFTALQNKIKSASEGSTINLYNNYTYNTDFNNGLFTNLGIYIDKTLTINGNGYSIDGLSKTRLCGVDGSNVKLKNIVFKNGYSHLSNGAIFWPGFKGFWRIVLSSIAFVVNLSLTVLFSVVLFSGAVLMP